VATVLYIKANAKPENQSRTFQISDRFISVYKETHPGDAVITLDLYTEKIQFLREADVSLHNLANPEEYRTHPVLKYAYQFREADKYVFAEPLWNLSIPAILKAYIDYITVTGITFTYAAEGPVGLCQGKKAVNITTRGGIYFAAPASQLEMGDRYLRTICGFLGIRDFITITAEGLDIAGQDVNTTVAETLEEAGIIAKDF
jgi:FMN-dependent NADH-azoreductase